MNTVNGGSAEKMTVAGIGLCETYGLSACCGQEEAVRRFLWATFFKTPDPF